MSKVNFLRLKQNPFNTNSIKHIMKSILFKKIVTLFTILGLVITINLTSTSCKKDNDTIIEKETIIYSESDKKIILPILNDHYGSGSGFDTTIYASPLINFNKNDYSNIDSIFFAISSLKTKSIIDGNDMIKTISVELIDLTHNTSIGNSIIITDDVLPSITKLSDNIISKLPNTDINIGVRIINDDPNCAWELHAASLIIIRN